MSGPSTTAPWMPHQIPSPSLWPVVHELMEFMESERVANTKFQDAEVQTEKRPNEDQLRAKVNELQEVITFLNLEMYKKEIEIKRLATELKDRTRDFLALKERLGSDTTEQMATVSPCDTYSEPLLCPDAIEEPGFYMADYLNDHILRPAESFSSPTHFATDFAHTPWRDVTVSPVASGSTNGMIPSPLLAQAEPLPPDASESDDSVSTVADSMDLEGSFISSRARSNETDDANSLPLPSFVFTPQDRVICRVALAVSPPRSDEETIFYVNRPCSESPLSDLTELE